jgi:hypothetical protein
MGLRDLDSRQKSYLIHLLLLFQPCPFVVVRGRGDWLEEVGEKGGGKELNGGLRTKREKKKVAQG